MARPRKCRLVGAAPDVTYFKPRGVPLSDLQEIDLSIDGYEALRLADFQKMKHEDAAIHMRVSRQTFGRTLSQARQTVALALVSGFALRIRGGDYALNHETHAKALETSDGQKNDFHNNELKLVGKEMNVEKVAISCEGPSLDDAVDPRFGRAAGFMVVNPETLEFEYVDNGSSQAMAQGAGIQAAENVAGKGVTVVLTGYVGPKAFMALEAANIKVCQDLADMTVRQAVESYKKGDVSVAQQPNRRGHGR